MQHAPLKWRRRHVVFTNEFDEFFLCATTVPEHSSVETGFNLTAENVMQ